MKSFFIALIVFTSLRVSFSQWVDQVSGVTTSINSISAVDNNFVWVCGASGKVLRTTNGGTAWTQVTSPNASLTFYHIWATDSMTALAAGSNANTFVYKTTNGGATWTQTFTQTGGFINAITQRVTPDQLLMVGNPVAGKWSVWESTDYGSSWDTSFYPIQAGTETGFNNCLYLHPQLFAWFGTNNSRLYKRSGMGYTTHLIPALASSMSVWFNDGINGMTGGSVMLMTTDGGGTWNTLTAPGTGNIVGITGAALDWWYCRGPGIFHSTNGGTSWVTDFTAPSGTYNYLAMARGGSSMWAVRNNGGISRSLGPIGIIPITSEVPEKFSLKQNYPNPFNPTTKIRFDIPLLNKKGSGVVLKVYDILGREITTLVNEKLQPGIYSVEWNASDLSSGIYLYKLQAGTDEQTKKMILLK